VLEPLNKDITDFESFADEYFTGLPHTFRESFDAHSGINLLTKMEEGYEAHYMRLVSGADKEMEGLVCINMDMH